MDPFLVGSDPKNLERICLSKGLNPRQTWWSSVLWLLSLLFVLLSRVKKNGRPDAPKAFLHHCASLVSSGYSNIGHGDDCSQGPGRWDHFLPSFFLGPPRPAPTVRSRLQAHPGVRRTIPLLSQNNQGGWDFVQSCSVCARNKPSNQPHRGSAATLPSA